MPTDSLPTNASQQSALQQTHVRAFPAYPSVERYFPGQSIEDARQRLTTAIERGDGPGLVIGASGTGKSLLLQALAQQFASQFDVAQLSCSQLCTRRALVQTILFELGLPYRFNEEGDLRLTLLDHLVPNERCPNGILLLVDEAQTLPVRLLEEIRLLTNLVRDGQPRVRLVLAGSLALEEQFATGELETFQQRIAARCYLAPLGANEIGPYVQAHLETGGEDSASVRFEEEAFHAIYSATDGVPRLVNQICARTLQQQLAVSCDTVDARAIQTAWADLQRLPTPWETAPESLDGIVESENDESDCVGIVEFGELSDDLADLSEPSFPASDSPAPSFQEPSPQEPPSPALEEVLPADGIVEISLSEKLTDTLADLSENSTQEDSPSVLASPFGESDVSDETKGVWDDLPIVEESASPESCEVTCLDCLSDTEQADPAADSPEASIPATQMVEFQVAEQPAANPFDESFVEEEVVLEDFAALGEVLLRGTPRVECQLDEQMSQLVHDVETIAELRAENEHAAELELELEPIEDPLANPATDSVEQPVEQPAETPAQEAIVDELDTLQTVPLVARESQEPSHHIETYDPVLPEEDYVPADFAQAGHVLPQSSPAISNEATATTIKYPVAELALCNTDAAASQSDAPIEPTDLDDEEDDILIVEDAPVEFCATAESDSVHRQDFRQLFAKLSRS